jgi:RimJ/RimL family protein N-acetyltransferase
MLQQFDQYNIHPLDTNNPEAFYKLTASNRSRLEDFFAGTVARTLSLVDTQDYCKGIDARVAAKQYFPFGITDMQTGELIGLVDVKNIDWDCFKAEIGYFVDLNYEGRGLTSKALGMVVDYIRKMYPLKQLLCRVASVNIASRQVAIRNGFEFEKTVAKDYTTTKGEAVDLDYYVKFI